MSISTLSQPKGIPVHLRLVLVLLAISVFINYVDRGNLSIAAPMLKDELGISGSQLGLLLSAFFWTYACMQFVSGWLVDRLNVYWVFAGGFFLWSLATATTGIVHTFAVLFVLRLFLGMGESVAFPSYSKILALNFPEEHRGFANAVLSTGIMLGPGSGVLLGGLLMARFGWRPFFIALGLLSMLWLIPWVSWIPKKQEATLTHTTGAPNLLQFVRSRSAWGTCIGLFSGNYVSYFLITWLPYYLVRERHFSMVNMAKIGGVAYLLGACFCTLGGWLSDRWIAAGATPTLVRKAFTGGGTRLGWNFRWACFRRQPALLRCCAHIGRDFLRHVGFQYLGNHSDSRRTPGCRAAGPVSRTSSAISQALSLRRSLDLSSTAQDIFTGPSQSSPRSHSTGTLSLIFLIGPVEQVVWPGELDALPDSS